MRPDKFLRDYRNWLRQFNDLRDIAHGHPGRRLRSDVLESFRNNPKARYELLENDEGREYRVYRPPVCPYQLLHDHRAFRGDQTVWVTNSSKHDTLMMLIDVDAKNGEPDAQQQMEYIGKTYLGGAVYIEPSRGGSGRHGYFFVNVKHVVRAAACKALADLSAAIASDAGLARYRSKFDGIWGLPTLWKKTEEGRWWIDSRGTLLKLPYVPVIDHFDRLKGLRIIPLSELRSTATFFTCINKEGHGSAPGPRTGAGDSIPKEDIGRTNVESPLPHDGLSKKRALVGKLLRERNGSRLDPDEVYNLYMQTCQPTVSNHPKDAQRRHDKIVSIIEGMARKFRPPTPEAKAFRRHQYLPLVTKIVPELEFLWNRREVINHVRLADFVSVKIQDAFFRKSGRYFGRASRDATLANFRALKAKGLVDWICGPNQYAKLLEIAARYDLLHVYDGHTCPTVAASGRRIEKVNGKARLIGPGPALKEEYERFQLLYARHCNDSDSSLVA